MKREWELYELIEQWTLVPRELEMLRNKTGATRLGYAVCLKFFQQAFEFPEKPRDVPKVALRHVAQQVDVAAEEFPKYFPPGRAAKYHRQQIREFCGFRGPTDQDAQALQDWLYQTILPQAQDPPFVEQLARQRFQDLRIEPLSPKQLQRVIRAALHQHEQAFCRDITSQLSAAACRRIDQLLVPETEENVLEGLRFERLSAEPFGAGLLPLSEEMEKLKQIRQLGLPLNLFEGVSDKIVMVYRRRAATERLVELRRHPSAVRYTLLSAFYWQRGQEVTDNLVEILLRIIHKLTSKAEYRVSQQLTQEAKQVESKTQLLNRIARAALANPEGTVREVIFPVVSPETLERLLQEGETKGISYRQQVHRVVRRSYLHYYRRMLPPLLDLLEFCSNNTSYQPIIEGLKLVFCQLLIDG